MSTYAPPSMTWKDFKQTLHGIFPGAPTYTEEEYPTLEGKVVLITGANTGVGYQVAKSLAGSTEATVYFIARSEEKSKEAIKKLETEVAQEYNKVVGGRVHFIRADLGDLTTIKPAVESFLSQLKRLDLIIHNAGVMDPPEGSKTTQGYEMQLGVNAIGHHLLQRLLDPIFLETAKTNKPNESRIVWLSSTRHLGAPLGGFDFDDPQLSKGPFNLRYDQSKALNAVQARWWPHVHAEAVAKSSIVSVSVCPGFLDSDLARSYAPLKKFFYRLFLHPVRNGAYTELFAGLSPDVTVEKNGSHIISFGKFGHLRGDIDNDKSSEKIWAWLDEQIKLYE